MPESKTPVSGFTVVRKGSAVARHTNSKPSDELLNELPDGTVVVGPDGVQWIAMPAVPRRWERSKKPIKTS